MISESQIWLDSLPAELTSQREILGGLLAAVERDPRWRWLELGCSLAAGRADRWSDLDLGLGVAEDAWPAALDDLPALFGQLGSVVDALYHRWPGMGDKPHQRAVVQYDNGVQIDLVAVPAHLPKGRQPESVMLYDPDALLAAPWDPSVLQAEAATVREWAFLGWAALADMAKYLDRGSLWEALERLHEARTQVWRLWAVVRGLRYPLFGMTAVLDHPEADTPPEMEDTVAGLDGDALRAAALACADLLDTIGRQAAVKVEAQYPQDFADFVSVRLTQHR